MEITPLQAASLAQDVYALSQYNNLGDSFIFLNNKYRNTFNFDNNNLLKAKTGGPGLIKCRTAFGFTLVGKGQFEGHIFLLFRGTQYLADWLTNLNATVSRSACGKPVHDGFNDAFKSMRPKLTEFMNALPKGKITSIHCIGHSLGGAVATVCADWIANTYGKHPYLYTFGSPRVGLVGFADSCTKSIGNANIFRAYHKTDVVPFVPVWPFIHTPNRGRDYYLPSPGLIPGGEYHSMDRYVQSVRGSAWMALAGLRPEAITDSGIIRWLKQDTPLSMTVTTLEWLSHAIIYVLKKCTEGVEWLISDAFTNGFTLLDKLAYILSKGLKLAETISNWVVLLMRRIMRLLGHKEILDAADLTRAIIHTTLLNLQTTLNRYVTTALNQAMVNGRAI